MFNAYASMNKINPKHILRF